MKRVYDWKAIQEFHDAGHGSLECQRRFGFTRTAWVKAVERGAVREDPNVQADQRKRYDWAKVQAYYDECHSYRECRQRFGFSAAAWEKARKRGEIRARPLGMPLEELQLRGVSRYNVKVRLLRAGLLKNECAVCGLIEWRGVPLSLHIDHVNGVKDDHRLENLRMLCPNCHSQTPTYGGKNAKRKKALSADSALARPDGHHVV